MSGGSSSSQPAKQEVTTTTSNLPEYARPYFMDLMGRAQAQSYRPYVPYGYTQDATGNVVRATDPVTGQPVNPQRIADFNSAQQYAQQQTMGLQRPGQFGAASDILSQAAQGAMGGGGYRPSQFGAQQIGLPNLNYYQMGGVRDVNAQQVNAPQMQAARSDYGTGPLERFRMEDARKFDKAAADEYMSPFMQSVTDVAKRTAIDDAKRTQLANNLGAARTGTYGGARQLLATTEREKALGQQLGDLQVRGLQSAFENAQSQFERDRAARMQTGQQNLQAALSQQQLGVQTGLQMALANLTNEQQARVNNQAMQFQAQGMNAENALRAALANQNVDVTRGQQNLQSALQTQQLGTQAGLEALRANQTADLEAQRLAEQSRQFGAENALRGYGQATQAALGLGQLGTSMQGADLERIRAQQAVGSDQQALEQRYMDMAYADFLRQRDYPMEQLGYFSNLMRGLPIGLSTTQTAYATPPSLTSQLAGAGLGAASLANLLKG